MLVLPHPHIYSIAGGYDASDKHVDTVLEFDKGSLKKNTFFCDKRHKPGVGGVGVARTHLSQKITMSQNPFLAI